MRARLFRDWIIHERPRTRATRLREYAQVRQIRRGDSPGRDFDCSLRTPQEIVVVVVGTLGETRALLRNVNCAEDVVESAAEASSSPLLRFYNELEAAAVDRSSAPPSNGGSGAVRGTAERGVYLPLYLEYCRHTSA